MINRRQFLAAPVGPLLFAAPAPAAADWLKTTYRELHLDAHFAQIPSPYETFDAESAAEMLKNAGFQMVSFFATCNQGFCYYPSKIGVVHPGLKRDYTGELATALHKRGVRVLAYVSSGPDRRIHKDHPEWMRQPQQIRGEMAQMCLNSPWVEQYHIQQLKELVALYDVDGFFLDNLLGKFTGTACICQFCQNLGGTLMQSAARYAEKVSAAVPGKSFVFCHLWVSRTPVNPPPSVKQLVWEPVPPYQGVLAQDFSFESRYLSNVPGIESFSCMATRGNGWGDYSIREESAFQAEAAVLASGGGRVYLSDDNYPSGNPDPAVYRVYGNVNRRTAALEPYLTGCEPVREIAVLLSDMLPVVGAHRALVEAHTQFGILNAETLVTTLQDYRVLVIAEQPGLSAAEIAAIRRFVQNGGALIVTGETPLPEDILGVRMLGKTNSRRAFVGKNVQVRGAYLKIVTTTAKTLLDLIPPDVPRQAPAGKSEGPAVTLNGRVLYCAVPIFTAYQQDGTSALRRLAHWMLEQVHPLEARAIALDNAPPQVEVAYNQREKDRFVHLLNYTGDKRLEGEFAAVHGIRVRVRSAAKPRRILLVPEKKPVAFEWRDGWTSFQAEPLPIHNLYLIEG